MAADADAGFLLVAVRAQPRARRAGIVGTTVDAAGRMRLRIAVTEPAEDGRATAAVCLVLARALGVPASRVSVQAGGTSREKLLRVEGDSTLLSLRHRALLREGAAASA